MNGLLSRRGVLPSNRGLMSLRYRNLSSKTSPLQSTYTASNASSATEVLQPIPAVTPSLSPTTTSTTMPSKPSPLSILPLSTILRSVVINSVSSSPSLLPPSLKLMSILANSKSPILSPDYNPILRFLLKHTFYKQFCAGETPSEVQNTVNSIKSLGFDGVFLCYAREVESAPGGASQTLSEEACIKNEITPWLNGTLATVNLSAPGDFVAIKFTGAGSLALHALENCLPPPPALKSAIDEICKAGAKRGVKMVFDAEHAKVQAGIDDWTLEYMKIYNGKGKGEAVVYGTYQAYLQACPKVVAKHLSVARREGFTLGVKLVRGAYIGSDPRHLMHTLKEQTDACYDGIAEALTRRLWNDILMATEGYRMPYVDVVIAGHNLESVRKVQKIRKEQAMKGEERIELCYAQLQGMADEVSCELVMEGRMAAAGAKEGVNGGVGEKGVKGGVEVDIPKAYKYLTWGTTGECMKYLLRRAYENRDAVARTREGRNEMVRELVRRLRAVWGLGGR